MNEATPQPRRCEICGDPLHGNNLIGICGDKPECVKARNRKTEDKRGRGADPQAEKRFCEVCKDPIRSDNRTGICGNHEKTACMRERKRKEALRAGTVAHRIKISVGDTFGRWTALEDYSLDNKNILVRCECGFERRLPGQTLVNGHSRGCQRCGQKFRKQPERLPYIPAGAVFGRLTVLKDVQNSTDRAFVRCEDGNEKEVHAIGLKHGHVRSCGCLSLETRSTLGGFSKHPLYPTWNNMIDRCTNPKDFSYRNYGGRTIPVTVCDRWLDPWVFAADIEREIGPRPEGVSESGRVLYSLDRWPDNNGNYEPGNVRWATASEQVLNQRKVGTLSSERDTFAIRLDVVTGERDLIAAERDALAAQNLTLAAQLQAVAEQPRVPRKRKLPPPTEEPLF